MTWVGREGVSLQDEEKTANGRRHGGHDENEHGVDQEGDGIELRHRRLACCKFAMLLCY